MGSEEKSKAIKGVCLAAIIGLPFAIIGNIKLSPQTVRSFQKGREEARQAQAVGNSTDATDDPRPETEAEKIADGSHCIRGWDLTFPALNDAVKTRLRNPASFEHISTAWSRMGKDGKFGLIMKYRAQNGFGGMNVDEIGVLVDARTCDFEPVSALRLAKRMRDDPSTS